MALEKLKIYAEKNQVGDFAEKIEVLFNPNQLVIEKTGWKESTEGLVAADNPSTLSIELFFDTTLKGFPPPNVQKYTQPVYSLTKIKGSLKRPPRCKLVWGTISGKDSVLLPDGFLQRVTKTLTHFLEDGTPVRATLNCTFVEWYEGTKQKKIQNPIDDPIRIVRKGETLSSIAAQEYNDPTLWRLIADVNRLGNPRDLKPGQQITVPPLRTDSMPQRR
ncbi:LysM peptidoglycan-binding domain-containing protein [Calothrix sp. FACHB-156]|nr:LysM peptidoglycan-binding domain-containing protein [Calothrix sp. FACHB-156]